MECSYARLIIAHLNRRVRREKVLEIGCGLGNILRNLKYNQKVGVDRDRNVINALSFFLKFSFLDNKTDLIHGDIKSVKNLDTSDAIILVNWIHEIDPITLKGYLSKLFDDYLNCGGEIIFDTVSQNTYKYNHDEQFLCEGLKRAECTLLGKFERGRNIYSIRKKESHSLVNTEVKAWHSDKNK